MKKFGYFTFSIVLAGLAAVWTFKNFNPFAPHNPQKVSAEEEKAVRDLSQKIYQFTMDGRTAKGVKQWHLEGKAAEIMGSNINLDNLDAIAYSDKYTVKISSDSGIFHRDKSEVELIGNVKVTSDENGAVLTTDRAVWSQTTREVVTDSIVNIVQQDMHMTGKGAKANAFDKTAKFLSDVTVDLEPSTRITCDGSLDVSFDDNKAIFHKNVRVVDKDGIINSDKMTVFTDPLTRKVAQVIAEGNVKVVKGNSYSICERATYTDGTRSVQLLGRPRIVIAPEELQGSGFLKGNSLLNR